MEIYADDINNASSNAAAKIVSQLHLDDEAWSKIYNVLIDTLNEICGNPDYKNMN